MQSKLGAGFLFVSLLYLLVGLGVPRLELHAAPAMILTVSLYLAIGLGAAWIFSRLISRRTRALAAAAALIREGDLTQRVETSGNDEIAEVARSFSVMKESLTNVVLEVQATAGRINDSALSLSATSQGMNSTTSEIATTAEEIARGADEQAGQVSRTTRTTRDLAQVVRQVARSAREVHDAASAANVRAQGGADDARRAVEGITDLSSKNGSTSDAIEGLRNGANRIGNLIASITSISHQTHLLAINAAIEAARAGEEGRGFGVVAEEVSRLADNVRRFAGQISTISEEIMHGSEAVTDQIRRSISASEDVSERVERSVASLEGVRDAIRGTADRAAEILELTERQGFAAEQVDHSLKEI
jgi:methyl-accepting chemotaxis protein